MATKEPQPNSGPARASNPFIHIPFQAQDLAGVEVTGGGATELTPVTPEFRAQLAATLDTTWQSLQQGFE